MFYELSEIKKLRKRLGLSQSELARMAHVSQSLLAKVEAGKLNPTYNSTVKIFNAIEGVAKKERLYAKDVMRKGVITAEKGEGIANVIEKMRRHGISQLPVMEGEKAVGMITEGDILVKISRNPENLKKATVVDFMEECPPIVSPETDIEVLANLLNFFPIVLISKSGKLVGAVTKADIISRVGKG